VQEGDLIEIGDYDLGIEGQVEPLSVAATPAASSVRPPSQPAASRAAGATAIIRVTDLGISQPPAARGELPKSERPRLVGLSQSIHGEEFPVERAEIRIGRARENDVVIEHPSLSRQHARLVLSDGEWKIIDNGSANGVRINGEPYAMSALRPGDVIELGHVKLRFCAAGEKFTPRDEVAPAASRARRSTIAVLVAVVLAGAGAAAYLLKIGRSGDDGQSSGEAALKAGDLLFQEKEFVRAVELYEQASAKGETPANLAKASDEAAAQRIDQDLDRALGAADFDKARGLLEKCAGDQAWYCQKAREKSDRVRQGYAQLHLEKARAAKGVRPDACQGEARLVLAFDPSNAQAQEVLGGCAPAPAAVAEARDVRKPAAASQSARDDKARSLLDAGNALVESKQYPSAMAKYQAALELKPSASLTGLAYRGLGTAAAYSGDAKAAARWFKRYLPYVEDDETREQVESLIGRYSAE
jgi:ABC transport system ATP-binding/permease protein